MSHLLVTAAAVLVLARSGVLCAPLCLAGDFDSQLRQLMHEVMLLPQDSAIIISRVLDDVQTTLEQRWQGQDFTLTPFGSLTTGLGVKSSDIDFSLQLRNINSSADSYVLQEIEKLLLNQPELYSNVRGLALPIFAYVSFFHNSTERRVDVVFRNSEAVVQKSEVIKYYFNLDNRYLTLGRFLKLWFRILDLVGHGRDDLKNFGLYLMIIFYLQQKNMVPPVYVLQQNATKNVINNNDMGFNELPYNTTNTESLHQLLGGFFKYYSEFNFEEYVISPFVGHPIPRSAFINNEILPKNYTLDDKNLGSAIQRSIKQDFIMSSVSIQDFFEHNINIGQLIPQEFAMKLKQVMKLVATMFEDLPSESILQAILVVDPPFIVKNATRLHVLNEHGCFEIIL